MLWLLGPSAPWVSRTPPGAAAAAVVWRRGLGRVRASSEARSGVRLAGRRDLTGSVINGASVTARGVLRAHGSICYSVFCPLMLDRSCLPSKASYRTTIPYSCFKQPFLLSLTISQCLPLITFPPSVQVKASGVSGQN